MAVVQDEAQDPPSTAHSVPWQNPGFNFEALLFLTGGPGTLGSTGS